MPLENAEPPQQVSEIISQRLRALRHEAERPLRSLRGADPQTLTPVSPHPIYVLGVDDLLSDDPLSRARMTGWRYLLEDQEANAVSSADTIDMEGQQRFARFATGPFVASTARALVRAAQHPEVEARATDLRLLNVPALHLTAIWLHADDQDLLTPLAPTPPRLEEGQYYSTRDLVDVVRGQAQTQLDIDPRSGTVG